jgi:heme-degrading monooxygenase HmoA
MFCVASCYFTSVSYLDEMAGILAEHAVNRLSRQTGFRGFLLLSKSVGESMALTMWETEDQASNWAQSPEHRLIESQLRSLHTRATKEDYFEVKAIGFPVFQPARNVSGRISNLTDAALAEFYKSYLTG